MAQATQPAGPTVRRSKRFTAVIIGLLTFMSCHPVTPQDQPFQSCLRVAQEQKNIEIKGYIFKGLGSQVALKKCGLQQIQIKFTGRQPSQYTALVKRADVIDVIGYNATVDGTVIEYFEDYTLLVDEMRDIREDPGVHEFYSKSRKTE